MNVFMEPLIDELLELWKRITMYEISKPTNAQREFQFHAMLVWTIYDALGLNTFLWYAITLPCIIIHTSL